MSAEETALLKMGVYKDSPSKSTKIASTKDEAQTASATAQAPAQTQAQAQQKSTTPSIQTSSSAQQNMVPQLPPTPQQKQDPVTIHSTPLPIQPAPPLTPQHVIQQQAPQVQQHTPLRTNSLSTTTTPQTPSGKPPVGSEEWHRQRRENHKEVERRRRDTINAGINELAKIVPGCEKNKGSILNRAVQYIQQLKENEAANIEKWTLEKLLTDQALQELQTQNEMLKSENGRLRGDLEELQGPSKKKQRTD